MTQRDVMLNSARRMGHSFVLEDLLEHGASIKPADILSASSAPQTTRRLHCSNAHSCT